MSLYEHIQFQKEIFKKMGFVSDFTEPAALWRNPKDSEQGFFLTYYRFPFYILTAADFKISSDFSLPFQNTEATLRFGSFHKGRTLFQMEGKALDSSTPVSFLVKEENSRGRQFWKTGQTGQGIELVISMDYLNSLKELEPEISSLLDFPVNRPFHSLPSQTVTALDQLYKLAVNRELAPLSVEGILLQCLGNLSHILGKKNLASPFQPSSVNLGKRKLSFTTMDFLALEKARQIIQEHPEREHTIASLSRQVFLNQQKLKAGFPLCFQTTVYQFLRDCRMALAARLLVYTEADIQEVALRSGYDTSSGFIKAFKEKYQLTPLAFRKEQRGKAIR